MLKEYTVRINSVRFCLIGPWETSDEGEEHCHAFLQFDKSRRRQWAGIFAQELKNMWIRPLEPREGDSILDAKHKYLIYCIKEGRPQFTKGIIPTTVKMKIDEMEVEKIYVPETDDEEEAENTDDEELIAEAKNFCNEVAKATGNEDKWAKMQRETKENFKACCKMFAGQKRGRPKGSGTGAQLKTKTSDIIKDRIKAGTSRLELLNRFPHMAPTIKQCLELHKPKYTATDCMYIYGPTGSGKTTTCKRVLNYFQRSLLRKNGRNV